MHIYGNLSFLTSKSDALWASRLKKSSLCSFFIFSPEGLCTRHWFSIPQIGHHWWCRQTGHLALDSCRFSCIIKLKKKMDFLFNHVDAALPLFSFLAEIA